jgi:hypothetical protein
MARAGKEIGSDPSITQEQQQQERTQAMESPRPYFRLVVIFLQDDFLFFFKNIYDFLKNISGLFTES